MPHRLLDRQASTAHYGATPGGISRLSLHAVLPLRQLGDREIAGKRQDPTAGPFVGLGIDRIKLEFLLSRVSVHNSHMGFHACSRLLASYGLIHLKLRHDMLAGFKACSRRWRELQAVAH